MKDLQIAEVADQESDAVAADPKPFASGAPKADKLR
jgi:hypothetical protein